MPINTSKIVGITVALGVIAGSYTFRSSLVGASPFGSNVGAPQPATAVVAYAPDGGMRVTLGSDVVPVSGSVNANVSGTVGVSSLPPVTGAVAVSGNVQAFPPDGGMDVNIVSSIRLDTVASTAPGTWLGVAGDNTGARLQVDIPGTVTSNSTIVGGSVGISGTVSLSPSSLAAITAASAERVCTYGTPVVVSALTTTASAQPASPQTGRTEITFTNLQADSRELWCRVSGTPSSTNAIVMKGGVSLKLNVTDAQTVNCMCSSSTCRINYQEASCAHP